MSALSVLCQSFIWILILRLCLQPNLQVTAGSRWFRSVKNASGVCAPRGGPAETKTVIERYSVYIVTRTGGWWSWTKYARRAKDAYREVCADGYGGDNCEAMCHGEVGLSACNRNEGYIEYLDGNVTRCSGGSCVRPDECTDCNEGYYSSSDGYCRACTEIDHCMVQTCTNDSNSKCSICRSEFNREKVGHNAFVGKPSKGQQCERACSWRKEYRCYPGSCSNDTLLLFSSCQCFEGFSGPDCATLSIKPKIYLKELELNHLNEPPLFLPDPATDEKRWTRIMEWEDVDVRAGAEYSFDPGTLPHYITDVTIGVTDIDVDLTLKRGGITRNWRVDFSTQCFVKNDNVNNCKLNGTKNLRTQSKWSYMMDFRHGDKLTFKVTAHTGGYVNYMDMEDHDKIKQYNITGQEDSAEYELGFDDRPPRHCYESSSTCSHDPLTTPDFTNESTVSVSWGGWTDDDGGMFKYDIHVILQKAAGEMLDFGSVVAKTLNVSSEENSINITLPQSGPYAIQLTAIDKAGNVQHARRLLLFDNSSVIETHGEAPVVINANPDTDYLWINKEVAAVEVTWPGRFINKDVATGKWLNEVKADESVSRELDDSMKVSSRNTSAIDNIDGIVRFEVGYDVLYDGSSEFRDFVSVPEEYFHQQKMSISEPLLDGMQLQFHIRAFDVTDKYFDDFVNVTIDVSPPIIKDLWLTKGDRVNISVHSLQELNKITFEWLAYDPHSGLSSMSWRLYDKYTDIVHGQSPFGHQGDTKTEYECKTSYGSFPRGADCYCTPFDGCFHRHFQVNPELSSTGQDGIHTDRQTGEHDSDYFIEITAVNKAMLQTVHTLQITLDTSPPYPGHVHEGFPGDSDVDFQTSRTINAHWSGFFDKESGVLFYMYGFGKQCLTADHFILDSEANRQLEETDSTTASFEASDEDTYYITVAAYNRALDPSDPVCSDGVTIDTTQPSISEVVIEGAITPKGLLKDSGDNVWVINKERIVEKIETPSSECISKATIADDQDLPYYPRRRYLNGTERTITDSSICDMLDGANLIGYVTSDTNLVLSWNVTIGASGIYDYEVGLASTRSTTPDKMTFTSSYKHQHARIHYPNIWNGAEFYIVVKTTAKSSRSNTQVIGPFIVSKRSPDFDGKIDVNYEENDVSRYLVANWNSNDFEDHGDPTRLIYSVAIGTSDASAFDVRKRRSTDMSIPDSLVNILPFSKLSVGGSCTSVQPPTCTAIDLMSLPWQLHDHHDYYVSVKAENTIGLYTIGTSASYTHDVTDVIGGLVYDVSVDGRSRFQDIVDIDFQTYTDKLAAEWLGFHHSHMAIQYRICYTTDPAVLSNCVDVGDTAHHQFDGITLTPFETYFHVVVASTGSREVQIVSDGITIVQENTQLDGIEVFDGLACDGTGIDSSLQVSHHTEDKRMSCTNDVDYQVSTNGLNAHWFIPSAHTKYVPNVHWSIEEKAPLVDYWTTFKDYEHIKTSDHVHAGKLLLQAGKTYRISIKLCAGKFCYEPVTSNGVTVVPNPPIAGAIGVQFASDTQQITVEFDRFFDDDIENTDDKYLVMDHYEWAITDNSLHGNILTKWTAISDDERMADKVVFTHNLPAEVEFSKCWRVAVRGYTKTGVSSTVAGDLQDCEDYDLVRPSLVIDALGDPVEVAGSEGVSHVGRPIFLPENALWTETDVDYTPYSNIISAAWPELRYKNYTWAVLHYQENDPVVFYKQTSELHLNDPCSLPETIRCGDTDAEFMNVIFADGELVHGFRYIFCIHAEPTDIVFEEWTQNLEAISICSDGVTVDLTPPTADRVWIGQNPTDTYQTSASDMSINWDSFIDVEEMGYAVHSTGIAKYEVALGSAFGGVDISDFVDVGIRNHYTFHNLKLQNGHTYFASVRGYDFTGQMTEAVSTGIKVDVTPPLKTQLPITIDKQHITDVKAVSACWEGVFSDPESGISRYSWSIGSQPGYDDMMTFTETPLVCAQTDENKPLQLKEGHSYYVSVKAYNGIGLSSLATSWAFTVDASPPAAGHVYDGKRPDASEQQKDLDYVIDSAVIYAYWEGFHDPHTPVKEYFLQIGSCTKCDDVVSQQPVGLDNDVELYNLKLVEGIKYFTSITACNIADLCTTVSSDGFIVDSSPPSPGRVLDGTGGEDIIYQASRLYLGATWYGFTDPQSGLSYYKWWAGTYPGADDILPSTAVHLQEIAFVPDLTIAAGEVLPVGVSVFITVRAWNKAGKYADATSNGFIVDNTPPYYSQELTHVRIGSAVAGTSVLRSVLKFEWQVEDLESFTDQQFLSISARKGGDFNLASIQVEGIVRDYTFTGLDLHDGCYYDVILVACNGARLCTKSQASDILVDGSPPTPGTFAVNTNHAANLDREPNKYMAWSILSIKLAWLGFEDIHSGTSHYEINIGSHFMGDDLNETPGSPYQIPHDTGGKSHVEGTIQKAELQTQSLAKLTAPPTIFIHMYSVNKVGQSSPLIHSQFELLLGGLMEMELIRRCSAHTCYGHCVCTPHGQVCLDSDTACTDISSSSSTDRLTVIDYVDITFPLRQNIVEFSPLNDMLAGCWIASNPGAIKWYEWSVGESMYSIPKGIFNEAFDRVWHDAGQRNCIFYVLPKGSRLSEKDTYSMFVRGWYNENEYAIFKSPGVMVYSTPPKSTVLLGRQVKETTTADKDIDFVDSSAPFFAQWTDKFINTHNSLSKYHVYLSTFSGGHDIQVLSKDLPPSVTSLRLTNLPLLPWIRYYTVVQAYNYAGLHTTETSDGFIIDLEPPVAGVVLDGHGIHDLNVQTFSDRVRAFWYGFKDLGSGIVKYEACLSYLSAVGECHLVDFIDTGIATNITFELEENLHNGDKVVTEVRATDAAGHVSETAVSNGVVIDTSAPVRENRTTLGENIVVNPSFETAESFVEFEMISNDTECSDEPPSGWTLTNNTCLYHVHDESGSAEDGKYFIILSGSIGQSLSGLEEGNMYKVTFCTSHLDFDSTTMSSKLGVLRINHDQHILTLYNKPYRSDVDVDLSDITWHKHTFYFHCTDSVTTITIGTFGDSAGLAFDNVSVQNLTVTSVQEAAEDGHVQIHTVFVHDWSSIHASWSYVDPESSIKEYLWAIGTVKGGTQHQVFKSVGKKTFAHTSSPTLLHNSMVHVTVVAINWADLRTVSYSDPILVDLTAPLIYNVQDGAEEGVDLDYQRTNDITVRWSVEDPESDVVSCHWAIGYYKGGTSLQNYTMVESDVRFATSTIGVDLHGSTVYVSIKCMNGAGLTSIVSSDGVTILNSVPSTDSVILEVIVLSKTQYLAQKNYHGDETAVKFRWTGFDKSEGIDSYLVSLDGLGFGVEELVIGTTQGFVYASFQNLDLVAGLYQVSVVAINKLKMYSQKSTTDFILLTEPPAVTGTEMSILWNSDAGELTIDWSGVFVESSNSSVYYEVTVTIIEIAKGDEVQWQETVDTVLVVSIDGDAIPSTGFTVKATVRAISYCGLFTTVQKQQAVF